MMVGESHHNWSITDRLQAFVLPSRSCHGKTYSVKNQKTICYVLVKVFLSATNTNLSIEAFVWLGNKKLTAQR